MRVIIAINYFFQPITGISVGILDQDNGFPDTPLQEKSKSNVILSERQHLAMKNKRGI